MRKVLLVEDDLILGETLQEVLDEEGYATTWVKDGEAALDATFVACFDLLLLDVNVPFINGFELLRSLREAGDKTPAIFITALVDIGSLGKGFDVGADDYMRKPFDMDELLIRMHVLIRRSFDRYEEIMTYGALCYNIQQQILYKEGETCMLPPAERKLLELFLRNVGKLLTKEQICGFISEEGTMSDGALRVHISHLKKLGLDITNIRTLGYRCEKL